MTKQMLCQMELHYVFAKNINDNQTDRMGT